MNIVDIAILLILAILVLGGWYKGFIANLISLAMTILAWLLALAFLSGAAGLIKDNEKLYNMLQYYTEGSEYVAKTDVELTRTPISQVTLETLDAVIEKADMPLPMGKRIVRNVAVEAFHKDGYTTLGDYFNLTIIAVVINILSALVLFAGIRILLGFSTGCAEHALGGYPVLSRWDSLIGAGVGLLHGVVLLFLLFLLVPIALTVLPRLYVFLEESFFGEFFYIANPFFSMIPGI